jgi:hypothetical protein
MLFFLIIGALGATWGLRKPLSELLEHGYAQFLVLRTVASIAFCVLVLVGIVLMVFGPWWLGLVFTLLGLAAGVVGSFAYAKHLREAAEDPNYDPGNSEGLKAKLGDVVGPLFLFICALGVIFY